VRGQRNRLLLGAAAAALLLIVFFRGVDWGDLARALEAAHPVYLAGIVVVTLCVYTLRAWRWGYLLAPLGRVRLSDLVSATIVGFASALLIPRAGEIVRPWLVSRRYPIPTSAGFATIILERLIDLITVLVLFAAYLFVLPTPAAEVQGRTMDLVQAAGAFAGAAAALVLIVLVALHRRTDQFVGALERLLVRAPRWLAGPASRTVRAFSGGLAVLRAPAFHLATLFAQSLLIWLLIALGFYLNHLAFSIDLPFQATFLLIAFLVVGVAIPTPGMVGGFHAFYLLALTEVYGIDRTTAAAAGIAAHALTNLPVLVLGLVLLGREGISLGRVAEVAQEGAVASSGTPAALPVGPEAR
jgi:uncharacterized protein (TIRG00374 family)